MRTYVFRPQEEKPLYEQLYSFLRKDIESGQMESGSRLPSKRKLAAHLKVSVITVEGAYGQLLAEGYIRSEPRRGFFVQPVLSGGGKRRIGDINEKPLSSRGQETGSGAPEGKTPPDAIMGKREIIPREMHEYDFSTNAVDTNRFPFSTWAKLMRQVLSEGNSKLLESPEPQGELRLREAIVRHLYEFRGIEARPEQVVVGAGSEYLTGLLIQLLGREGGYAVENPGYHKIHKIFEKNGAKVKPVPLDEEGLQVERLRDMEVRVVHVTPSHHFPMGIIMPAARRMALLHWAQEREGRYIIEDDYDSEFRFAGRPIPALKRLDQAQKVIYMNTFAKSLAPSLRIGYVVLPPHLMRRYQAEFLFYASTVPVFEQVTLARFMEYGHFERHINRMRSLYKARRDALTAAASNCGISAQLKIFGEEAGLHLLMQVSNGMSEQKLVERAKAEGVGVYGLSSYYAFDREKAPDSTLVMGYAKLREEDMAPAFTRLERAWRQS